MNIKHTKKNEQQQKLEQEEENYITGLITIEEEQEEGNISERNEGVEDMMNNSEEIADQMSNIIDDVNYSR